MGVAYYEFVIDDLGMLGYGYAGIILVSGNTTMNGAHE